MTEIKFRAWHKKHKRMFGVMAIHFNPGADEVLFLGDGWEGIAGKEVIPLEYTDFKDKNGKEICQSDLVVWDEQTCEVKKDKGMFFIEPFREGLLPLGFAVDTDLEVIGNIYENPELLKNN